MLKRGEQTFHSAAFNIRDNKRNVEWFLKQSLSIIIIIIIILIIIIKTKVITLANQKGRRQSRKPMKIRSNHT